MLSVGRINAYFSNNGPTTKLIISNGISGLHNASFNPCQAERSDNLADMKSAFCIIRIYVSNIKIGPREQ